MYFFVGFKYTVNLGYNGSQGESKMSVIAEVHYIRGSVKLLFNITFKFIPLKLRLFSVLLHMDMNSYILHTQKHTLLHS
jgi:hypothetical protein